MDLSRGDPLRLRLETSTLPVLISPSRTALVVIDMQNFFLDPTFRDHPNGLKAYETLLQSTIPTCRRHGIDIIFVNWGLTEYDLKTMPPMLLRSFSKDVVNVMPQGIAPSVAPTASGALSAAPRAVYVGLGADLNAQTPKPSIPSSSASNDGETPAPVIPDRLLMRGTQNARLYGELHRVYLELKGDPSNPQRETRTDPSSSSPAPSRAFLVHKNRLSGLWGQMTPLEELLHSLGITTLLFAGVNTDQCVSGTLSDAFSKGFDCILLSDACGTTSPSYMTDAVHRNVERCWGFLSDTDKLRSAAVVGSTA